MESNPFSLRNVGEVPVQFTDSIGGSPMQMQLPVRDKSFINGMEWSGPLIVKQRRPWCPCMQQQRVSSQFSVEYLDISSALLCLLLC